MAVSKIADLKLIIVGMEASEICFTTSSSWARLRAWALSSVSTASACWVVVPETSLLPSAKSLSTGSSLTPCLPYRSVTRAALPPPSASRFKAAATSVVTCAAPLRDLSALRASISSSCSARPAPRPSSSVPAKFSANFSSPPVIWSKLLFVAAACNCKDARSSMVSPVMSLRSFRLSTTFRLSFILSNAAPIARGNALMISSA